MRHAWWVVLVAAAAAFAVTLAGFVARDEGADDSATTAAGSTAGAATTTAPSPRPYSLAATRRCLLSSGFSVSPVRTQDVRLRALGDVAQRTSLELEANGATLGLAFGDTRLLIGVLRVPDDPYRLVADRNALLMYRPADKDAAGRVRRCLR